MKLRHLLNGLLLLTLTGCAIQTAELPTACQTDCRTPYGIQLGTSDTGISAYSNCSNQCVVIKPHFENKVFTGIEWQCVEFARRWLLTERGMVFASVDVASDIWDKIHHYTRVEDSQKIAVNTYLNGHTQAPAVGDLLIYGKALYGTGHVAVVTQIDSERNLVRVAEQNYRNEIWPADYAREIPIILHNGHYWLLDHYLIGWKHPAETSH